MRFYAGVSLFHSPFTAHTLLIFRAGTVRGGVKTGLGKPIPPTAITHWRVTEP